MKIDVSFWLPGLAALAVRGLAATCAVRAFLVHAGAGRPAVSAPRG